MIRQAISCDICGAEKKQTNHWFVAYTQGGELRVAGWTTNGRIRSGVKHLCGQTCLHKLVDEFIAGTTSNRIAASPEAAENHLPVAATDASLTSKPAYTASAPQRQVLPAAIIAISPSRSTGENRPTVSTPPVEEPEYGSPRRRAEAWERERERCSSLASHRKTL
jgi:hypothetical protein